MTLNAYDLSVIAGAFTMLGALVGAICTYRFALHLQASAAKREAGRRLRDAFAEELAVMSDPSVTPSVAFSSALKQAFPKHSAAVREFAFHLSDAERSKFEAAWRKYWEVGGSVRFFDYYMGDSPREVFVERVEQILRFTGT